METAVRFRSPPLRLSLDADNSGHETAHGWQRESLYCSSGRVWASLLEQIGLLASDAGPQRLELEPSRHVGSDLLFCRRRVGRVNLHRLASAFGQKLGLAAPLHGDKPPHRLIQ